MKFCKNLQKVADLSNPEWSPYWTDYKRLKKIIKTLAGIELDRKPESRQERESTPLSTIPSTDIPGKRQRQGDRTAESSPASGSNPLVHPKHRPPKSSGTEETRKQGNRVDELRNNPGEVLFFKALHAEFHKAVYFFDRVIAEFAIREERVQGGLEIVKEAHRLSLWSTQAKSVYRLYTDLLLLETFCIMTYCSFSKILKKHDKVTGFETRNAFMSNVVNKANFTTYTSLQDMISRCEVLYSEVSSRMVSEGQHSLYEDERLFIDMIHQLNRQV